MAPKSSFFQGGGIPGAFLGFCALVFLVVFAIAPFGDPVREGIRKFLQIDKPGEPPPPLKEEKAKLPAAPPPVVDDAELREYLRVAANPLRPERTVSLHEFVNQFRLRAMFDLRDGALASEERERPGSYQIQLLLQLKFPAASRKTGELYAGNRHLRKMLPDLPLMLESASVSDYFHKLYRIKIRILRKLYSQLQGNFTKQNLDRFNYSLTRHNFYDCQTILNLRHPETKRRVLFIQGEMDVDSDGSDGDRMEDFDHYVAKSPHFQPFTSYSWPKRTKKPNPLLPVYQEKLREAERKEGDALLPADERASWAKKRRLLRLKVQDLRHRSFLIGQADPYIVIPLSMRGGDAGATPKIGDYAVVIHGKKIWPTLVGDYGPPEKIGEGSLRLARALNPEAEPMKRPESDLKVTYLLFPGSAESRKGPPDLELWRRRCQTFLEDMGGLGEGFELERWRDFFLEKKEDGKQREEGESDDAPDDESPEQGEEEASPEDGEIGESASDTT